MSLDRKLPKGRKARKIRAARGPVKEYRCQFCGKAAPIEHWTKDGYDHCPHCSRSTNWSLENSPARATRAQIQAIAELIMDAQLRGMIAAYADIQGMLERNLDPSDYIDRRLYCLRHPSGLTWGT